MRFIGLKLLLQNGTLLEEVGQPSHDHRVEHVNLEEEAIAHVKAVERHAFGERDARDKPRVCTILIAPVADRQGMVY